MARAKPAPTKPAKGRQYASKAPSGLARGEARPKAAPRRQRAPSGPQLPAAPPRGRERYTSARFFGNCSDETAATLRRVWANGDQLAARRVPTDGLPCVVILAAYAVFNDIALVDDYDALIQRYDDAISVTGTVQHPDLFFSSSCSLLHNYHGKTPSREGFESICVPRLWRELLEGETP